MSKFDINDIKQKVGGDVTASFIQDVAIDCNSEQELLNRLNAFRGDGDEEIKRQQQRKVDELKETFPGLKVEIITNVLLKNNWDVDASVLPLLEIHQEESRKEIRRQNLLNAAKQRLEQIYAAFSEQEFQRKLEENDGDVETTITYFMALFEKKELERREKESSAKKQIEMDQKIATLEKRFKDLKREEIVDHLKRNNGDLLLAGNDLLKISEERKIATLSRLFKTMTPFEIQNALDAANWEFVGAVNILTANRLQRREQEKKEADEKKKSEQQIKQQPQPQPQKEYPAPVVIPAPTPAKEVAPPVVREQTPAQQQKLVASFMNRSTALIGELEKIMHDTEQHPVIEKETAQLIRDELEIKLRTDPATNMENAPVKVTEGPSVKSDTPSSNHPPPLKQNAHHTSASSLVAPTTPVTPFAPSGDQTVTINVRPSVVDVSNPVVVDWTVKTEDYTPQNDWIALYHAHEDDPQKYLYYEWTGSSDKKGTVKFSAPAQYGQYRFCYLKNKTYRTLAQSQVFTVGPQYDLSAQLVEEEGSRTINVTFNKRSGNQHPNAWVGMYKPSSPLTQFHAYEWLAKAVNNTISFPVPKVGDWIFRLFPERTFIGSYVPVAECTVSVKGTDTLKLTWDKAQTFVEYDIQTADPASDQVWIGLYFETSEAYREYRRFKRVTGSGKGKITFKTPIHQGTYNARLFAHGDTTPVKRSNSITVPDSL